MIPDPHLISEGSVGRVSGEGRPVVVYVLGNAFSGSTLFSLALGTLEGIVNLGEVSSLENGYVSHRKCSCGQTLSQCEFWAPLRTCVEVQQREQPEDVRWSRVEAAKPERLDARYHVRSARENLRIALGVRVERIFSEEYLERYARKSELFFRSVMDCVPGTKAIVDCSKQPERLEALVSKSDLDLFVVYLRRDPVSTFASLIKRQRRRRATRRAPDPDSFVGTLFHALRLRALSNRCGRIYRSFPPERRREVRFEDFLESPAEHLKMIAEAVGAHCDGTEQPEFGIDLRCQHLYVGNRWIHDGPRIVKLRVRNDVASLSATQRKVAGLLLK